MGTSQGHRVWSEQNAEFARRLAVEDNATARRWAVVAAYYSVMHALQAVAADNGEQRLSHDEVVEIPAEFDLANHKTLEMRTRELYGFCNKARYLRGSNVSADAWFLPYAQSAEDLTDRAIDLMEQILEDL